jgi:hypothetical protein
MKKTTADYILTPQGLVHKSRVRLAKHEGERGTPAPNRFPPSNSVMEALSPNGWIASATFAAAVALGKMSVKFTVPEAPSAGGAVIFLFPGAQNAQMRTILQPVLQWGHNGAFGGECWKISCWHASTDGIWSYSPPADVSTGDIVTGTVEMVQCSPKDGTCTWLITASTEQGASTVLNESIDPSLKMSSLMLFLVGAALEAYPEESCCTGVGREQYPASGTKFTDIKLTDLAGNPFVADWAPRCNLGGNEFCSCKNTVQISPDKSTITLKY